MSSTATGGEGKSAGGILLRLTVPPPLAADREGALAAKGEPGIVEGVAVESAVAATSEALPCIAR